MSISVAGRPLPQLTSVSELGRLVLACIDGGREWASWAIASPSSRYEFDDETSFVAQVQQGLHASPLTLLPVQGLLVSPVKLMTLGMPDLRVLMRGEMGDSSAVLLAQRQRVLADHGLLLQSEVAAVGPWLGSLGQGGNPLFQALSLPEAQALHELLRSPASGDEMLDREAASFAAQQARTPLEFADYLRLYRDLAARPDAATNPEARAQRATRTMQTLLPLLFSALDCPQLSGLPAPGEVADAVSQWLSSGRRIGFSRLSEGLLQVLLHTHYRDETGDAAQRLVDQYLASAQSFLAAARVRHGRLGQDGASCIFPLEAGNQVAELQLTPGGVVALRSYGLRPPPAAPLPTPTPAAAAAAPVTEESPS